MILKAAATPNQTFKFKKNRKHPPTHTLKLYNADYYRRVIFDQIEQFIYLK